MYQGSASINLCNARNHLWKEGPPLQWKETEARGKELRTGVRRPRLALPQSLTPEPRLWHTWCCEFQVPGTEVADTGQVGWAAARCWIEGSRTFPSRAVPWRSWTGPSLRLLSVEAVRRKGGDGDRRDKQVFQGQSRGIPPFAAPHFS